MSNTELAKVNQELEALAAARPSTDAQVATWWVKLGNGLAARARITGEGHGSAANAYASARTRYEQMGDLEAADLCRQLTVKHAHQFERKQGGPQ